MQTMKNGLRTEHTGKLENVCSAKTSCRSLRYLTRVAESRFWAIVHRVTVPHHERLLRGVAAAKSLSRCGRLHHRRGIHHSDRFGGFSGMGIAKLDVASCGRAFADRISDRVDSWPGPTTSLRKEFALRHAPRIASAPQSDYADRNRRDHFCWSPDFSCCPRASARKIDKSIAVLPFQSLSDEKENAYFADGMQDDILTNLSKIGDLKVISRMSVMSYRGDAVRNAREIGKALGVATLLEGSVRRVGNRVRVNVQLINANNDEHIWAEDYDRDLTDVFAIQTDLAQKIASALQAKLSPNEKARLDHRPTQNPTPICSSFRRTITRTGQTCFATLR